MSQASITYLGPYRLSKVVYTGQATRIWRAYHDGTQQFAAVKTLLGNYRQDRERIGQLRWECKVGQKLDHPGIIRIHEFGIDRGTPYLAMEWFPAPSMRRRIHEGLEEMSDLLPKVILGAAEALAYFNDQGWIHRDIKPDNFLVDDHGNVKLIDFALARRKRGFVGRLFGQRSKVQGTRSYMSPEQIRSYALDERADLYSLGCTFFHLVAGTPPFTGGNTKELLMKHLKARPPSLEAANPSVTPAFSELIRQTMAKRASDRPASAREFLRELRTIPVFLNTPELPPQTRKPEG